MRSLSHFLRDKSASMRIQCAFLNMNQSQLWLGFKNGRVCNGARYVCVEKNILEVFPLEKKNIYMHLLYFRFV